MSISESDAPTCVRELEIERGVKYVIHSQLGMKVMHLGGFKGSLKDKKRED